MRDDVSVVLSDDAINYGFFTWDHGIFPAVTATVMGMGGFQRKRYGVKWKSADGG